MSLNVSARPSARENSLAWALPVLLVVGFVLRLLFIGNDGFKNDVQTFEAWALSLSSHGFAKFYATAGFADYPPGYFYILAAVGNFWNAFFRVSDGGHFVVLKALVKLPA
ncbi:MAG TPA: hypothetical protein VNG31_10550, partial [Candidatus Baltobacteraceae bacterium]|nr:hypothetical protein [Candidatus Baltobacteraceae bacterium]